MTKEADIFALLDSVYGGDSASVREATLDSAVQSMERTQRAYTALRQFTENGKVTPARETVPAEVVVVAPEPAEVPAVAVALVDPNAPTRIMAPLDPEATEIVRRAPRPNANPLKPDVVSGTGADFHAAGFTKTHIVRPKKWFK